MIALDEATVIRWANFGKENIAGDEACIAGRYRSAISELCLPGCQVDISCVNVGLACEAYRQLFAEVARLRSQRIVKRAARNERGFICAFLICGLKREDVVQAVRFFGRRDDERSALRGDLDGVLSRLRNDCLACISQVREVVF